MSWLDDPERRRLLVQEEEETGYRFSGRANWMGYGRWLSRRIKQPVATWKVNLLVLLSLYPTAMLVAPLLQRLLGRIGGTCTSQLFTLFLWNVSGRLAGSTGS